MPDAVEISAKIESAGKTARKALDGFQEKKGEFNTAVNPMNFTGIETAFSGPSVGPTTAAAQQLAVVAMGGGEAAVDEDAKSVS